jgi:acyl carrier protein
VVVEIAEFTLRAVDVAALAGSAADTTPTAAPAASGTDSGAAGVAPGDGAAGIAPGDGAEALFRLLAVDLGAQVVVSARPLSEALRAARELTTDTVEAQGEPVAVQERPAGADFVAPRTELEAAIARVWGGVLGIAQVGVTDDFFELGGNSLVAVQLISQIRKELGVKLPMRSLFVAPTVASMAELVSKQDTENTGNAGNTGTPAPATTIPRLARPGR